MYPELILLTKYYAENQTVSHPVAPEAVVAQLSNLPLTTGLLPPNTLFWQQQKGKLRLGVFVRSRQWTVNLAGQTMTIPLPAMVFVGEGRMYEVFAVKKRPLRPSTPLFRFPAPNIHVGGRVCSGRVPFPICTTETIHEAATLFLEGSQFNGDLVQEKCRRHHEDVRQFWLELENSKRFPTKELLPTQKTLAHLMQT